MSESKKSGTSRRDFLKNTSRIAATSALVGGIAGNVHAGEENEIRVALVGCGGRGTGAAANALSVKNGPLKLVAMADVFEDRLKNSYASLERAYGDKVDVPEQRKFIGFNAYRDAMDTLRAGDIVILTTPPAFRWVQFTYAIEKGLNVFMEKPVTVDGPSTRKMLDLGEQSVAKNLKVGVGLMCRHCHARGEQFERIQQGEIGDITLLRAYRMAGPTGNAFCRRKPEGVSELEYQVRSFHAFLWASGGAFSDFLIHNVDECCWMKNAWPVEAKASGGRHYRGDYVDQNFDSYSVEYTFADGTKLMLEGRTMSGCHNEFASYAHGTKGSAIISTASHAPSRARLFNSHNMTKKNQIWQWKDGKVSEPNPYQTEWDDLVNAIRTDTPYNEVKRGAEASLTASMGRLAAHTGQVVTFEEMLNHEHEFAPDIQNMTADSPAPVVAAADGTYPVPAPGLVTDREYEI